MAMHVQWEWKTTIPLKQKSLILEASLHCPSMLCPEWPGKDIISTLRGILLVFISQIRMQNSFLTHRHPRPIAAGGVVVEARGDGVMIHNLRCLLIAVLPYGWHLRSYSFTVLALRSFSSASCAGGPLSKDNATQASTGVVTVLKPLLGCKVYFPFGCFSFRISMVHTSYNSSLLILNSTNHVMSPVSFVVIASKCLFTN